MLLGTIKGELIRYTRNCSDEQAFISIRMLYFERLLRRGYPNHLLTAAFAGVSYADRADFLLPRDQEQRRLGVILSIPRHANVNIQEINRMMQKAHDKHIATNQDLAPVIARPMLAARGTSTLAVGLVFSKDDGRNKGDAPLPSRINNAAPPPP